MPDKKITDLTELTTPVSTDVLAIVDVAANVTKKIQVGNLPGGSGGGVTAVTGTAPITSTGGATPDIGITNATPSADGAMSAADKAKLDGIASGAQVGTVTSVATGTGLTGGTITGAGTVSLDANLADLNDVAATAPSDGQVLTYDTVNGWQPENVSNTGTVTSVTVDGGTGIASSGSPITGAGTITVSLDADLADLNDVSSATPIDGQVLTYDPINGWQPESVAGTVTAVNAGTGLDVNGFPGAITSSGTLNLTNTGVTAGTYTNATVEVDAQGRVINASSGTGGGGVSSLETLTGALNLVGAGTVTVTDNGSDTITITGSGGGGGIAAVVDDTSPQLGGNLDVFDGTTAHIITTTQTNGNIAITPDGTGVVQLDGLSYPTADGTVANQPMVTDASGQLSFSGTVTANVAGQEINFNAGTAALSTAGDAEGTVVYFGNTNTTTAGKVYTFFSGDWEPVDASVGGEDTTKGLLAMALGTTPATDGMLIQGIGILDHTPGSAGDILYVDTVAAGELTATQPSTSNEYSRVVGHQIGTSKVLFIPSQDWIKIA